MGVGTDAEVKTFSTRVITAPLNEDKYQIKYGRLKDRKGESTSVYKKEKKSTCIIFKYKQETYNEWNVFFSLP